MAHENEDVKKENIKIRDPSIVPCQIRLIPLQLHRPNVQNGIERAERPERVQRDQTTHKVPTTPKLLKPNITKTPIKLNLGLQTKPNSTKNEVCIVLMPRLIFCSFITLFSRFAVCNPLVCPWTS